MKVDRKSLIEKMTSGVVSIAFEKKDGTIREMACTLSESIIPQESLPKNDKERKRSDESIAVFDVEKAEWRSFRWDSLKSVQ